MTPPPEIVVFNAKNFATKFFGSEMTTPPSLEIFKKIINF